MNSAKHEVGSVHGGVRGSYSWRDEAGYHTVNYVADEDGYRIVKWTDPEDGDHTEYKNNMSDNANVGNSQSDNSLNSEMEEFYNYAEAFLYLYLE